MSLPTCPPHIPLGTHKTTAPSPPQADTHKFAQTHIYSPTRFRFPCGNTCFALLSQEGGAGVVRECSPPPLFQRAFRALEDGGLSGSLRALGFPDPLTPDCSPWGDWGRIQDIVRRWLGSSKFQEAHPGLVQATKYLGMSKGLGGAGWIWFTM